MSEDYIKTMVIEDPNYSPGTLIAPTQVTTSPVPAEGKLEEKSAAGEAVQTKSPSAAEVIASFEDTSWLT